MDDQRIDRVSEAIAGVGYDGIVAFDEHEPEYGAIESLYGEYDDRSLVKLLVTCATTQDFQLNGDAQLFWPELTDVSLGHGSLSTVKDVEAILWEFMERPVNSRFGDMKGDRLRRLLNSGFCGWFLADHEDARPLEVWERLAEGLGNQMHKKTVVLSMKIYDIAYLIDTGEYLEFPRDIPIPCDLQVERVSHSSGISDADDQDAIMDAWAEVMKRASGRLRRHVSLLRIDSIVWQAGQIIGHEEPDVAAARRALVDHFEGSVGVDGPAAERLAIELTEGM